MTGSATAARIATRLQAAGIEMSEADLSFLGSALPALDAACAIVRAGMTKPDALAMEWRPSDTWSRTRRTP